MSKIQNLKANHNYVLKYLLKAELFVDVKDTKSESKSQPLAVLALNRWVVCRCQRYKIWKQITTRSRVISLMRMLFVDVKDTKSESKSQQASFFFSAFICCLSMSKIQNLKANHNPSPSFEYRPFVVCRCQRYKIWKQITTSVYSTLFLPSCLSMSKIQNLKANHNSFSIIFLSCRVVCRCQRYKIWKQITTRYWWTSSRYALFVDVKDTKSESKSQPKFVMHYRLVCCLSMSKIQNLKANHNAYTNGVFE